MLYHIVDHSFAGWDILLELDENGDGTLTSKGLKAECPCCSLETCNYSCDGSQGAADNWDEIEQQLEARAEYNAAIDGMESFLLALACAGVDVLDPAFKVAINTAVDAIANHFPEP